MWLGWWGWSALSYRSAKFDVMRSCGRIDIRFFICHATMWSKRHMIWWVRSLHPKSPVSDRGCGSGDIKFYFVTWSRGQWVTWRDEWGPTVLSYYSENEDVRILMCKLGQKFTLSDWYFHNTYRIPNKATYDEENILTRSSKTHHRTHYVNNFHWKTKSGVSTSKKFT